MVSFLVYDLVLLFIFIVFFLHTRKKNIQREGLLILYKTSWGIKLIDYLGKRHPKTLRVLSWISIVTGNGKEHMALISALINLPVGIRFAALTKDGVIDL